MLRVKLGGLLYLVFILKFYFFLDLVIGEKFMANLVTGIRAWMFRVLGRKRTTACPVAPNIAKPWPCPVTPGIAKRSCPGPSHRASRNDPTLPCHTGHRATITPCPVKPGSAKQPHPALSHRASRNNQPALSHRASRNKHTLPRLAGRRETTTPCPVTPGIAKQ